MVKLDVNSLQSGVVQSPKHSMHVKASMATVSASKALMKHSTTLSANGWHKLVDRGGNVGRRVGGGVGRWVGSVVEGKKVGSFGALVVGAMTVMLLTTGAIVGLVVVVMVSRLLSTAADVVLWFNTTKATTPTATMKIPHALANTRMRRFCRWADTRFLVSTARLASTSSNRWASPSSKTSAAIGVSVKRERWSRLSSSSMDMISSLWCCSSEMPPT